ncbi:MAG TPA: hypothetical protein VNO14_05250, partial [Blastocatellia bacterium]|nr:hypothetical protein [Blastocatellia bacterium]
MFHPSRIMAIALAATISIACAGPTNNTNVNQNRNGNANANSSMASADAGSLEAREPQNYSTTMTISGQWSGGQRQGDIPTLQFDFARMGNDRRWSFNLPQPVGEVVFLEKEGLKYLIIPSRNQYVELRPEELGFDLGRLMTPVTVIERL